MKKILITGGMGFVGSVLYDLLQDEIYDTAFIDNGLSGDIHFSKRGYVYSFYDPYILSTVIPQYDIIVHLAAIVGAPACDIDKNFAYQVNVLGTQALVNAIQPHQKLVFTSSTSAYGNQSETVTEENTLSPLTAYGVHKALAETIIKEQCKAPYIILRPATAFGASHRIRLDLLPNTLSYIALTQKVIDLFEPDVIRPFIHVYDFARVIKWAIDEHMEWNEVYNIGDPHLTMQKKKLASIIADLADAKLILREGSDPDMRNYDIRFDKLLNTGFTFPKKRLQLGFVQIASALPQLKENPDSYSTPHNVKMFLNKGEK
jgi:nucleoside-diphosphate-sugar epimerase